jgi:hypothetical protein
MCPWASASRPSRGVCTTMAVIWGSRNARTSQSKGVQCHPRREAHTRLAIKESHETDAFGLGNCLFSGDGFGPAAERFFRAHSGSAAAPVRADSGHTAAASGRTFSTCRTPRHSTKPTVYAAFRAGAGPSWRRSRRRDSAHAFRYDRSPSRGHAPSNSR